MSPLIFPLLHKEKGSRQMLIEMHKGQKGTRQKKCWACGRPLDSKRARCMLSAIWLESSHVQHLSRNH